MPYSPNFWIASDTGENMLRGVEVYDPNLNTMVPDPDNPAKLPSDYIIEFLRTNQVARMGFNDLYPRVNWTPAELERLDMIQQNAATTLEDYQQVDDTFMRRQNVAGIYTTGPNGGRGGL